MCSMPTYERTNLAVDVVVEALVREHLTKKKYSETLKAFKAEQPSLQHSITKRSALQQILGLQGTPEAEVAPSQQQCTSIATSCSTLELWVQQYLNTTTSRASSAAASAATRHAAAPGPASAAMHGATATASSSSNIAQSSVMQSGEAATTAGIVMHSRAPGTVATVQASRGECLANTTVTAAGQQQQQQEQLISPNLAGSSSRLPATGLQQRQKQSLNQQVQSMSSRQSAQAFIGAAFPAPVRQAPTVAAAAATASASSPGRPGSFKAGPTGTAGTASAAAICGARPTLPLEQQLQKELVIEDVDDKDIPPAGNLSSSHAAAALPFVGQPAAVPSRLFDSNSNSSTSSSSSSSGPVSSSSRPRAGSVCNSSSSSSVMSNMQPLLPEHQRQLSKLLWGDETAKPDAAWQQGLIFSKSPGLEWGFEQLAGGPCGVLAAVQAHLIATLMEQGLWGLILSAEQLQAALVSSLATIIWTARCSSAAQVVMHPLGFESASGMCDAGQAVRMVQVATADSLQELEALIKSALPQWSQRKGWGLLLLLYSLLLTRSCAVICEDMDDSTTSLVDQQGYCSMELVNLMLAGTACSNVFDAQTHLGGSSSQEVTAAAEISHLLSGVAMQARVGLLTLFEWYRYVEVGQNLKSPRFPVWVICSESHFTTLAVAAVHQDVDSCSRQGLAAGLSSSIQPEPQAAVVLEFYDGMARQEGPIQLVLQPAGDGEGWSSRMDGVAGDRGAWCGQLIPPLECVCETKWKDVQVVWQGSEPIL